MSNNKNILDGTFDPIEQLSLLKEKCNNISSHLYQVNSLYLEELRKNLPQVIRSSIFTLITDRNGDNFGLSTVTSRKRFQVKIDKLVSDTISLITIEQLSELAKKIDEENILHLNHAKEEIENSIKMKNNPEKSEEYSDINSINISSIPPLDNLSITEGWKGEIKAPYSINDTENYMKISKSTSKSESKSENPEKVYKSIKDGEKIPETLHLGSNDIEILQSIFSLQDQSNSDLKDSKKEGLISESSLQDDLFNNRLLPQSPIGLYEWMLSLDTALVRRLRDLSHTINTELLKSGLVNTLVPVNILDAALAGQLISSKPTSNILNFKLPTNSSYGVGGVDVDCLLITPSDMEFDNPRLRKNKTYLKHYQNVLLGMIKQQRYWQGRSLSQEVKKQWWKDTKTI